MPAVPGGRPARPVGQRPAGVCRRPPSGISRPVRMKLDPARSVAVWLAISEATSASGCLEIAPGSHHGGYLPYRRASSPGCKDRRPLTLAARDGSGFTPVPLAAGQACVLDVRLVHCSGPNTSSKPRIGLNIRYVAPGGWVTRDGPGPHLLPVTGDRW